MEDKHIYLLAQFDDSTNQKLTNIYNELIQAGLRGQQTLNLPYHFTLGSFNVEHETQVLAHTQDICRRTDAFNIHLTHIGLFGLNILFIAPSMNHELINLHNNMVPNKPTIGVHNWVAHATLLIDEPDGIQKALPIVSQAFTPFIARIESVSAYEFFPAKFIASFKLRNGLSK